MPPELRSVKGGSPWAAEHPGRRLRENQRLRQDRTAPRVVANRRIAPQPAPPPLG